MTKSKLNKILLNLDAETQTLAKGLIDELIFQQGILKQLKRTIKEQGVVSTYSNGMPRESPALKSYNATIQRYSTLCKQLELMLRNDGGKSDTGENALKEWLEAQK